MGYLEACRIRRSLSLANDQLHHKRKAISADSLRRRVVNRAPEKRILIVCEGEETERRYFEALIASMDIPSVDVDICDECDSAPKSVVAFAEKKAREEGPATSGGYSRVFCVIDRDTHETFDAAISKIFDLNKSSKFPSEIYSIVSNPCFEFWFILHFGYCRAPFSASSNKTIAENVVSQLQKITGFEGYEKAVSTEHIRSLIRLTEVAVGNAKKCIDDVNVTNEPNPSTRVFEIVEYLRGLKADSEKEMAKSK